MSTAEQALESAILAVLAADESVAAVLGSPMRVLEVESTRPALPYLEIVRHQSVPAGSAGVEASEHRLDLAVVSRLDGGAGSLAAVGAIRSALEAGEAVLSKANLALSESACQVQCRLEHTAPRLLPLKQPNNGGTS